MCGPEDPLFTPLLPLARVPFKQRVSSQDPLLRKFGNFSLNSLNFHPNFSSQAPKFGNFQLTSLQIWKFSAHKPPNLGNFPLTSPLFRGKCPFRKPHTLEIRAAHPYLKKVECPPPPRLNYPLGMVNVEATHRCFYLKFKKVKSALTGLYITRHTISSYRT